MLFTMKNMEEAVLQDSVQPASLSRFYGPTLTVPPLPRDSVDCQLCTWGTRFTREPNSCRSPPAAGVLDSMPRRQERAGALQSSAVSRLQ